MIPMSRISDDCSLENMGFAVGSLSISQFVAKLHVLLGYSRFSAAILNFWLKTMSIAPLSSLRQKHRRRSLNRVDISMFLQVLPLFWSFPAAILDFN